MRRTGCWSTRCCRPTRSRPTGRRRSRRRWLASPWLADETDDPTGELLAALERGDEDLDGCWPPPGVLDEVEPGPLLAALAAETDLSSCGDSDLVGVVAAAYRLQSWAAALEVRATNVLVDRCASWRGVVPAGQQVSSESVPAELMASVEVGCALDLAPQTARGRVAFAADLRRLPATRLALAAGVIDVAKARLLVEELRPLAATPTPGRSSSGSSRRPRARRGRSWPAGCAAPCSPRTRPPPSGGRSRRRPSVGWRCSRSPTGWPG